jgi:hypothetical protein
MGSGVYFRGYYPTSKGWAKGLELPKQKTFGTTLNQLTPQSSALPKTYRHHDDLPFFWCWAKNHIQPPLAAGHLFLRVLKKSLIIRWTDRNTSKNTPFLENFRRTHAAPETIPQTTYSCSCMGGLEDRFPGWMLIVRDDRRLSSRCWKNRSTFSRVFNDVKMPNASVSTAATPMIPTTTGKASFPSV